MDQLSDIARRVAVIEAQLGITNPADREKVGLMTVIEEKTLEEKADADAKAKEQLEHKDPPPKVPKP